MAQSKLLINQPLLNTQTLMQDTQNWYIVKRPAGHCEIVSSQTIEENGPTVQERWGPFNSQDEAIARRVGLIRASKCQPQ